MNLSSVNGLIDVLLSSWWFVVLLVILLLAFLWMQQIKATKRKRPNEKRRQGFNPVIILGMVTVFALVLMGLPWYIGTLEYRQKDTAPFEMQTIDPENRLEIVFQVEGMTCTGCESLIHRRVGEMNGVQFVRADHELHEVTVVFDKSLVDREQIISVIEDAGYQVTGS